ncbi:LOW QUALITY PROTEIN: uncharacterized protein LOC117017059, partial [Rhinolophus ferrumequinum]|uniref:LOW QUALITY PROTEIN: uncharacterized protein LOC117017059 n=1 Tax=Rhinolophus ferrumequinum TaxID=59479 RepID=UPI00140FB992
RERGQPTSRAALAGRVCEASGRGERPRGPRRCRPGAANAAFYTVLRSRYSWVRLFTDHQRPQYQSQGLRSGAPLGHRRLRIHGQGVDSPRIEQKTFSQIQPHASPNTCQAIGKGLLVLVRGKEEAASTAGSSPDPVPRWLGLGWVCGAGGRRPGCPPFSPVLPRERGKERYLWGVTVLSERAFCLRMLFSCAASTVLLAVVSVNVLLMELLDICNLALRSHSTVGVCFITLLLRHWPGRLGTQAT